MGILQGNLEPHVELIKIRDRYKYASRGNVPKFDNSILDIEILKDKKYTLNELAQIIRENSSATVVRVFEHDRIEVEKRYVLKRHRNLCTMLTIYDEGVAPLSKPSQKIFYMDFVR